MADMDSDSSSSESSSSSELSFEESEDDNLLEMAIEYHRRPRNALYFEETIPQYTDEHFMEHFRISRNTAENISEMFKTSTFFNYQSGLDGKLEPLQIILIFLWFAGHQTASFRDVADRFDISISSLFKIIKRVTYFLSGLSPQYIKWPTNDEKINIENSFRNRGFPGVIGAIDGTYIRIDKPSEDPDSYLNRKQFHSIQLQAICDHRRKILDVYVGFPGSVHDSRVFRSSPISQALQEKCGDKFLLGDSAYPCLRNLLTPYRDYGQLTRNQRTYNIKLSKNRYVIEHCFGLLKQRFRQLYHIKLRSISTTVHFIRACCVLHNMTFEDNFNFIIEDIPQVDRAREALGEDEEYNDDRVGLQFRNYVANNIIE